MAEIRKVGTKKMQDAWNKAFDESPVIDREVSKLSRANKVTIPSEVSANTPGTRFFEQPKELRRAEESAGKSGLLNKFGKLAKVLGIAGAVSTALNAGNKAMAGDIPGAGLDVADLATDQLPGIAQAKMALQSSPVGEGSDVTQNKDQFDFSPYKTPSNAQNSRVDLLKRKLQGQ